MGEQENRVDFYPKNFALIFSRGEILSRCLSLDENRGKPRNLIANCFSEIPRALETFLPIKKRALEMDALASLQKLEKRK